MPSKEIILGNNKFLAIDLTQPLREDTEVYPGDPKPVKEVLSDIHKTGCQHHIYRISNHHFHPHADAPKHLNIELQDKGAEIFDLDYCFNSACLIDLSDLSNEEFDGINYLVEVKKECLKPFAKLLSQKEAVLIRTGYDRWLEANKLHNPKTIPYLTEPAAKFIASFDNIKVIGIDSLTVDSFGNNSVHRILKNKMIIEAMVNLHEIPTTSRENFDLQTSPLRIVGATAAPIVAYVFIRL